MSEKLKCALVYFLLTVAIILSIAMIVIGNVIEGWSGVIIMLGGMSILIFLLYLYNRKHR